MREVALLGCTKSKRDEPAPARELYRPSALFRKRLRYAELRGVDELLILSAKHGVVDMETRLAPYDVTLNDMPVEERRHWATEVIGQLEERVSLDKDRFVILAGKRYYEELLPELSDYEIPTEGMSFGRTLSRLDELIERHTR